MAPARQCYTVSANAPATTIATRRHDLGTANLGGAVAGDRRLAIAPLIVLHRDRLRAKTRRDWFRDRKGAGRPPPPRAMPSVSLRNVYNCVISRGNCTRRKSMRACDANPTLSYIKV
jgi:hypothetical protein